MSLKDKYNKQRRERYAKNKELFKEKNKKNYVKHKDKYNEHNKNYHKINRDKDNQWMREYNKERHLKLRRKVIEHYSNGLMCCACCGEKIMDFLTIDHINGGGRKHYIETKRRNLYEWLTKNNFPEGFQILCSNCNCSKGKHGKCIHQMM